ncbi:hypothetical protein A0257_07440 [Hymenobacter psoromatis]|nr:hypothetical protein A0257_07440 [Hymenobacter psoromatis]
MLEEARIRSCDWDEAGGSLEYDISHLHPAWDVVIQAYEIRSVTHDGHLVYASDFTLYRRGSAVPADFSSYPKAAKQQLWAIIFAIKRKFFVEVRPAVVEHFIKAPYQAETRLALYQLHLDLRDYDVALTSTTFTFLRRE